MRVREDPWRPTWVSQAVVRYFGKEPMPPTSTPIPGPLSQARFVHRPNRFLLQVRLEDTGKDRKSVV